MSKRLKDSYQDALGVPLELSEPPQRIISLVPSLTEALFAFGLSERIVGVTRYCVEPAASVAGKPKVGGTKNLDLAKMRSLQPDLVFANVEENTKQDIGALQQAGVTVFMTYARTVADAIEELAMLADITEVREAAEPFLEDARAALAQTTAQNQGGSPVTTFCPIWRNP